MSLDLHLISIRSPSFIKHISRHNFSTYTSYSDFRPVESTTIKPYTYYRSGGQYEYGSVAQNVLYNFDQYDQKLYIPYTNSTTPPKRRYIKGSISSKPHHKYNAIGSAQKESHGQSESSWPLHVLQVIQQGKYNY